MKKLMLVIAVSMVSVLHAKTFKTAIEYNNFIVGEQVELIHQIDELYEMINGVEFNAPLTKKTQKALSKQCSRSIKKIKQMGAFAGNDEFRSAGIVLLNCYLDHVNSDLVEIISIRENSKSTEADFDRAKEMIDEFDLACLVYFTLFEMAQEKFADDNHFSLSEN